jgi:hypothetical protein
MICLLLVYAAAMLSCRCCVERTAGTVTATVAEGAVHSYDYSSMNHTLVTFNTGYLCCGRSTVAVWRATRQLVMCSCWWLQWA